MDLPTQNQSLCLKFRLLEQSDLWWLTGKKEYLPEKIGRYTAADNQTVII